MRTLCVAAVMAGPWAPLTYAQWLKQDLATTADFRGLCAVSPSVAWVSGTNGTFARTVDAGKTWAVAIVPGADRLDFRDVEAFGPDTAYLMSAGLGENARIYKTTDGGKSWSLQFKGPDRDVFLDAIAFWDEQHGIALGDPVKGSFYLIHTTDGGATWTPLRADDLPPALPNEGAFAASGTCLVTHGPKDVWFVTGGAKAARVFRSTNRGRNWTVSETPIRAGTESAGIFSIAFRDSTHGMIVGGDYRKAQDPGAHSAVTSDGGKTWTLTAAPRPFRSCVAWAVDRWIAVGTTGSEATGNDGGTWNFMDRESYNSVAFTSTGEGWAAGPKGRVARYVR